MAQQKVLVREHPIVKLKVSDLVFDPSNPNVMSDEQMNGLKLSMKKFGYLIPVVVDMKNKIADGEHRAIVYKDLGLKEIPAIRMKLETEADRRELRQVLNKLHGLHDKSKDADELVLLLQSQKLDELSEMIAQPAEDLRRAISRFHPGFDSSLQEDMDQLDTLVEQELNKKQPNTKPGDIYELGNHRLICGDCTNKQVMSALLKDDRIAQLNCDPPYGIDYSAKNDLFKGLDKQNHIKNAIKGDGMKDDIQKLIESVINNVPFDEYNTIYIWSLGYKLHEVRLAMKQTGITWGDYLVWIKNRLILGRKDYYAQHEFCIYGWKIKHKFYSKNRTAVLNHDKPIINRLHPTMKPIELIKQTIEDGTKEGDIVLDTFAGSGTSLIASEQTQRIWRGIELDPWYCDVIIKRWEMYTGKEAVKVKETK